MIIVVSSSSICKVDISKCLLESAKGGADYIMIREKRLSKEALLELSLEVSKAIGEHGTKLIVNSDVYAAKQVGAHAVHLSFGDFMSLDRDRMMNIKKFMKIGVSIHSAEEASRAEHFGADYILAGHIFHTNCKAGIEPRGIEFIKDIKDIVNIPLFAIGGINSSNITSAIDAGADGAAVMSIVMESNSPRGEVEKLKTACRASGKIDTANV
ncbi:thiamine phosphate synthase [Peptoclostridium litorale]|nr:thiamine phosphate synthase [Peptoclostridium litorale]